MRAALSPLIRLLLGVLVLTSSTQAWAISLSLGVGQQEALTFESMAHSVSVDKPGVIDVTKGETKSIVLVTGRSEGNAELTISLEDGKTVVYRVTVAPSAKTALSQAMERLRKAPGISIERRGSKYVIAGQFRSRSDQLVLQAAMREFPGLIINTTDPDILESNAVVKAINAVLIENDIANIQAHAYGQIIALEGSPKDDHQKALALRIARMISSSVEDHIATDSNGAPAIAIEVLFIESSKNNKKEYGVTGPEAAFAGKTDGRTGIVGGSAANFSSSRRLGKFDLQWQVGALSAFLRLQQTKISSRVVSNPKLVTRSGQKATFESGGAFYIQQIVRGSDGSSTQAYTPQQTGISLSIEPRIDSIGQIDGKLKTTIVDIDASEPAANGAPPNLLKSNLETAVTIQNGQSILLSGLTLKKARKTVSRVPLLADIPILGELFKERNQEFDDKEVAVIVTMTRVAPSESRAQVADQLLDTSESDVSFNFFD